MKNFLKYHWRLFLPLLIILVIFFFSASSAASSESLSISVANFLTLPHDLTRKIAHFILFSSLGAAWYYYFRTLSIFTPSFTSLGSLLLVIIYAFIDELHQTFIPGRSGQISDVLLDSTAGLLGIILCATIHYVTRTKSQKSIRKKQIEKIWQNNAKLHQKLRKSPKN